VLASSRASTPRCSREGRHSHHVEEADGVRTAGLPNSVHERALSASDLSSQRRSMIEQALCKLPKTRDEIMDACLSLSRTRGAL
jgi:hypothetical protein